MTGTYCIESRQLHEEDTSLLVGTLDPYFAADCFDKFPTKVKAEASTTDFTGIGIVDAIEFLKKVRDVFLRNADSGIFDTDDDRCIVASYIDLDASLRSVLDSVFDKVVDDLAQVITVHLDVINRADDSTGGLVTIGGITIGERLVIDA